MNIHRYPEFSEWPELLARPAVNHDQLFGTVRKILQEVRERGDAALRDLTHRFDNVALENLLVKESEIEASENELPEPLKEAIRFAESTIRRFHEAQDVQMPIVKTATGVTCWQKSVPIEKVGLYVPGGTAPLFSTVLMLAVPAQIAGCREIVLCTPCGKNGHVHPAVLFAAKVAGVKTIIKVGGAQAIAAMAYGTESVPKVYKIFGPGNSYVTTAKQLLSLEEVAIDMPAGPSEVEVLADETAKAAFVASDLLSQAEHGKDSQALLITTSESLAEAVVEEVYRQLDTLERKDIAKASIENSRIIVVASMEEAIKATNEYAPEHLILAVNEPRQLADRIVNAGSVFLGHYTPESVGDYASGTNHTLPTHGYAKAYSGVHLDSYRKRITFQELSPEGLQNIGPAVETMAEAELLTAHKQAVRIRLNTLE
ncbi:MAG: histidinol dehydrogenase [Bacteroidales bacterium]